MPITCIGVGPGDKELITIKAVKAIEKADCIIVPEKKEGAKKSTALGIAKDYIPKNTPIIYMYFPMIPIQSNKEYVDHYFSSNGKQLNEYLAEGKDLVFLTLGDPNVYSTFSYIKDYLEEDVQYIPGIASFLQGAAITKRPLCLGQESFGVINMTDDENRIKEAFRVHDSLVVMKVSANPKLLKDLLITNNKKAEFLSNMGLENESVKCDMEFLDGKIPYFTIAQVY